jgi:hypothetical protein
MWDDQVKQLIEHKESLYKKWLSRKKVEVEVANTKKQLPLQKEK